MFCARLFICALWSPAGKGLTSWLSFVVSSVSLSLSHWYPGSGVVLDCIDSWSLHHYLLLEVAPSRSDLTCWWDVKNTNTSLPHWSYCLVSLNKTLYLLLSNGAIQKIGNCSNGIGLKNCWLAQIVSPLSPLCMLSNFLCIFVVCWFFHHQLFRKIISVISSVSNCFDPDQVHPNCLQRLSADDT